MKDQKIPFNFAVFALALVPMVVMLTACVKDSDKLPPKEARKIALPSQGVTTEDNSLSNEPIKLPPPQEQRAWQNIGGGIAASAEQAAGHVALADRLKITWQAHLYDKDDPKQFILYPPVSDGKSLFILDRNAILHRYDLASGRQIWRTHLVASRIKLASESGVYKEFIPTATPSATGIDPDSERLMTNGGLMVAGDKIVAATGENQLVVLDTRNGWEIWRQSTSSPLRAPPLINQDRVFAINSENVLLAYDLAQGKKLYEVPSIPDAVGYVGGATPASQDGLVVAGYRSGEVFGVIADSGRVAWGESLAMMRHGELAKIFPDIMGRPLVERGTAIAASRSGQIAAIDMRSGDILWERRIAVADQPWLVGEFIYLVTKNNEIMCLLRNSGKTRWVRPLFAINKNPSDAKLKPVDLKPVDLKLVGPILAGERLVVADSDGMMRFLSPFTGEEMSHIDMAIGISIAPIVIKGQLIIVNDRGQIYNLQ
ncbi:MAG: PQQ-binding-like beta-propeller repeat protein [Candidatus Symbiobacter sp.]|nr:PQQ-binding-like beta-propeller repeat protein [Candidatus Symbiobacter sp.]